MYQLCFFGWKPKPSPMARVFQTPDQQQGQSSHLLIPKPQGHCRARAGSLTMGTLLKDLYYCTPKIPDLWTQPKTKARAVHTSISFSVSLSESRNSNTRIRQLPSRPLYKPTSTLSVQRSPCKVLFN